jgi:putative ABC transport system permease protein
MSYVWRNLLQRKVRTGLAMLGVAVAVAGIVALISVARGFRSSFDDYMVATGASLIVFNRDAADIAFSEVHTDDIAAIEAMPEVEEVGRTNFTMIVDPRFGDRRKGVPYLFCFGRVPGERLLVKYRPFLVEGRMPQSHADVLAGSFVADQLELRVGDRLPLFRKSYCGVEEYEICGIFRSDITWENGGLVMHADVLKAHLNRPDSFSLVFVYTAAEVRDEVQQRIEEAMPHLTASPAADVTDRFENQIEIIDEFILVVTLIALVVGILGVLNTMMMSISERTREIGMLRALGWPRSLVVRLIVAEGILLSCVGGLLGLLLGVLFTEALMAWFPGWFLVADYTAETFLKGMAVALVVGTFAAIYPAWRAANLRPVEALRYE